MVSNLKNFFKILALGVGIILAYMILSWDEYLFDIELWPGVESPRVLFALVFYYSKNVVIDKHLLNRYKNIQTKKLIVDVILDYTPIYVPWLRMKSRVKSSNHCLNHISNALRLALIWKYGGIYLDTDIIKIKDLSFLLNFPGMV